LSISPIEEGEVGLALQQALDAMSDVYVVYDSSWRFVFQNRAQREAMKRAGLDPDWAMGKVLWDVIPFLAGTAGEAGTRKAMVERVITEWEESYPPDLRLHGRAFPTPDGGVAVVARDVSEQWKSDMLHRAADERTFALQKTTAALASAMTVDRLAEVILSKTTEKCTSSLTRVMTRPSWLSSSISPSIPTTRSATLRDPANRSS
jgi:hypothetical protein